MVFGPQAYRIALIFGGLAVFKDFGK